MQKRLLVLFILLGLATLYSLLSLHMSDKDEGAGIHAFKDSKLSKPNSSYANTSIVTTHVSNKSPSSSPELSLTNAKSPQASLSNEIPIDIKLVGISDAVNVDSKKDISVLLKYKNDLHTHTLFDFIGQSDIQIVKILTDSIDVNYQDTIYTIKLILPNLLASKFFDAKPSETELLAMTSKDISTRPRMIEHLVTLTPTPYIADGKIVSKGMNPDLFEQAGFKIDDVLKTINGKRVTVEDEYAQIQEEIKTALTLEFVVMRRGKLITLYLDIPSETLELLPQ